jgi:hypothetical protein
LLNDMIDWIVKKQFIVSIFIIEAKFFSMLHADKKNSFDEYISFRNWSLIQIWR